MKLESARKAIESGIERGLHVGAQLYVSLDCNPVADLAFGMLPDPGTAPGTALDASRDPTLLTLQTSYEWNLDLDGHWGWKQTNLVGSEDVPPGNNQIISKNCVV